MSCTPRPSYLRQTHPVATEYEAGWATETVRTIWRIEKHFAAVRICFLNSFSCSLFVLFPYCFFVLMVLSSSLVLTVQHTTQNIYAPRGIRTRNPSKQSAVDPRSRSLGHWEFQIRTPKRPVPALNRYIDNATLATLVGCLRQRLVTTLRCSGMISCAW